MPAIGDSSTYNPAAKWNGSSWQVGFQAPGAGGGAFPEGPPPIIGGNAGAIASQAAGAADPFASQRPQYQEQLSNLMQGPAQGEVNSDIQNMRDLAGQPLGGPYMSMLEKLMTDPNSITQTPGSQYAMQQGQKALERSNVAKGFLGSGNIMSALQTQGQGEAAQDYNNQLANIRAAAGLQQGMQGQQFSNLSQVAGASGGELDRQTGRLSTLAGATTSQPGTAGSLLAKQFDWANQGGGGVGTSLGSSGGYTQGGSNYATSLNNEIAAQRSVDAWNKANTYGKSSLAGSTLLYGMAPSVTASAPRPTSAAPQRNSSQVAYFSGY